jgi:hypothetical protein
LRKTVHVPNQSAIAVPFAPLPRSFSGRTRVGADMGQRRSTFLPKEHGSWSLAFEPLALGLLVAPSTGGFALATATVAAFFARRPLRAAFGPDVSVGSARSALLLLSLCVGIGLGEAGILGSVAALWPLLLCSPFLALFLRSDLRSDPRSLTSELAGSAVFALLPAAIATLAGWPPLPAIALAAVMAGRSLPTVVAVRSAVRIRKNQEPHRLLPVTAALGGLLLLVVLATHALAPWAAVGLGSLLLARSAFVVAPRLTPLSPRRLGSIEVVLGILYVAGAVIGYRL